MKRFSLLAAACLTAGVAMAQCTADYDFGDAGFGISPDPVEGEQFASGVVNEPYEEVLHVLVPSTGDELGDLVPEEYIDFAAFITIDSLSLAGVEVQLSDTWVDISDLGLEVMCNNNGDSPIECNFMGGEQYCASLSGTPNQAGVFPMRISVNIYFFFLTDVVELNEVFDDDFFLTIESDMSVGDLNNLQVNVSQNTPNPAQGPTTIDYTLSTATSVQFTVTNLLGEAVHQESLVGRRGSNRVRYDASELNAGIYLYSIEAGTQKITKRMIVR